MQVVAGVEAYRDRLVTVGKNRQGGERRKEKKKYEEKENTKNAGIVVI
jgi:hypothetical protein